ncbi:Bromodomain containing protein [Trichomonas vaginalis G3]|uniref:Bromodomain containing protein n=1 Tax=Trichomonas vaginalis (strain ATCC PRA-98 / G3) TaxID=412133 RepID=A2DRQ9_TRIV3|nr:acetylation-dependent protein binding [Trichomonas vaginalis G3]EAY16856.1 Bromodomain containing protein [Trichomonas vaginalis G3]KAI5489155.1 acetylation-dependent protein binding [Trichomonas vaginalis G3]|eukprot:XP_001329079.1 Bromodomain containing protein [Trichomonas vaginalis G3]
MNDFERQATLKITTQLMEYKIACVFCEPIDLNSPDFADYARYIKQPMDLLTVKNKILSNSYSSADQWKADVDLVFSNAILYYRKTDTLHILAEQMKFWFNNLLEKYPVNPSKWQEALERASYSYMKLLINTKSCRPTFPNKILQITNPTDEYVPPAIEDTPPQKQYRKQEPPSVEVPAEKPRKLPKEQPVVNGPMNESEKLKLAKAIREITDEAKLVTILTLLQAKEPAFGITENSSISLNQLQVGTLRELRNLVRSF